MIEQGRGFMHSAEIEVIESIKAQGSLDLSSLLGIASAVECQDAGMKHQPIEIDSWSAISITGTIGQQFLLIGVIRQ